MATLRIRRALPSEIFSIMDLSIQFGHSMTYQKDKDLLIRHISEIVVAENPSERGKLLGHFHFLTVESDREIEYLKCYKQFPNWLLLEAVQKMGSGLTVCMQGASHREVFKRFILWAQKQYPEIWCWCSLLSKRPDTYRDLGFTFHDVEKRYFFNVHKGDYSTYRLGRWTR